MKHGSRRAYILLVVLAFTALASSLGISFLEANSTVMPEAVNYSGTVRAETLASSGIAMASHYLLYPPTTVDLFSYYTGVNGATIDSSGDYFDVSVSRSDSWSPPQTDLNLYRLIATGVAKDPNGAIRAKRSITAEIQAPPIGKWQFTQALWSDKFSLYVPSRAFVSGDIHSNGNVSGNGACTGAITASGLFATWGGGGPPTSISALAANIARPNRTPYQSSKYTIRGKDYAPYTSFLVTDIDKSSANALNAVDMSATNPGRIIIAKSGDIKVRADVQLKGTLVVNGTLRIEDAGNHVFNAVPGFPALVVIGDIELRSNNSTTTINGSVICTGALNSLGNNSVAVTVKGTCFLDNGLDIPNSNCTYLFNWDSMGSVLFDIQNLPPAPQPMTILDWKEN